MFGNKYMADELAKNFQQKVSNLKKAKLANEQAIKKEAMRKTAGDVNAEEFLTEDHTSMAEDPHSKALDKKIEKLSPKKNLKKKKKMSSDAKSHTVSHAMENCAMCGMAHDQASDCYASDENDADDWAMDKQAQYVLYELGKVAAGLRNEGNGFAADMVETTAIEIKNEEVKKVAGKIYVVDGLIKMAKESRDEGDLFTSDVILATINDIKKS